jgi:transcriptional regulator with XRE-family HTH domain
MLGLSEKLLAKQIGLTPQQVHKYECGINRVSAGRLYEVANVLGVPVNYFFDALRGKAARVSDARERRCLELARNCSRIENEKHQHAIYQLIRALAGR